jgi:hypothetical protein
MSQQQQQPGMSSGAGALSTPVGGLPAGMNRVPLYVGNSNASGMHDLQSWAVRQGLINQAPLAEQAQFWQHPEQRQAVLGQILQGEGWRMAPGNTGLISPWAPSGFTPPQSQSGASYWDMHPGQAPNQAMQGMNQAMGMPQNWTYGGAAQGQPGVPGSTTPSGTTPGSTAPGLPNSSKAGATQGSPTSPTGPFQQGAQWGQPPYNPFSPQGPMNPWSMTPSYGWNPYTGMVGGMGSNPQLAAYPGANTSPTGQGVSMPPAGGSAGGTK